MTMWAFFGGLDEIAMQWVLSRKTDRFSLEEAASQVAEVFIRGMLLAPSQPSNNQTQEAP